MAVAPIRPLTWEPPYATGVAVKRQKKKRSEILFPADLKGESHHELTEINSANKMRKHKDLSPGEPLMRIQSS